MIIRDVMTKNPVCVTESTSVTEAKQIQSVCSGFDYVDISKINNRATGAMVSSVVGAGTGAAGTIVSVCDSINYLRNYEELLTVCKAVFSNTGQAFR